MGSFWPSNPDHYYRKLPAHWSRSLPHEVSGPLIQVTTTGSCRPTDPGHYYRKLPAHWSRSLLQEVSSLLIQVTTTGSFQPTDSGHYCRKFPAHWSRSLLMGCFQPTDPGHYHGKFLAHWSKSLLMGCVQPTDPGNYCLDEHIWWPGLIQFCRDRELLRNANAETSLVTVYQDLLIYLTQCYCASRPTCLPNAMLQEIKTNFISVSYTHLTLPTNLRV